MFGRQLLRRLDAHMERGNELTATTNAHMERGNELMVSTNAHMKRGNELMVSINAHMERGDQLMERLEKTMADISREVALTAEEVRLSRESRLEMRDFMRETFLRSDKRAQVQTAALQEVHEESRAHTQALLRLMDRMDRLDPGGSAAAG